MTVDLHNMQNASAPDLVAALIEELGALPESPATLRCLSIAFAIQSKVSTAEDVIRENT